MFLGSGLAISQAGPAAIIAYIVCGLVALVVAWALAEMVVVHRTALIASVISLVAADTAYFALFGVSVFGALVVWILILVTHLRFRVLRERLNLPASRARLKGAPVTTVLAMLFVATVLASTLFIDGLKWAWIAGLPFLAVVLGAYFYVDKRTKGSIGRYDPLAEEIKTANALPRAGVMAGEKQEKQYQFLDWRHETDIIGSVGQ